jgi:hypothetical protein
MIPRARLDNPGKVGRQPVKLSGACRRAAYRCGRIAAVSPCLSKSDRADGKQQQDVKCAPNQMRIDTGINLLFHRDVSPGLISGRLSWDESFGSPLTKEKNAERFKKTEKSVDRGLPAFARGYSAQAWMSRIAKREDGAGLPSGRFRQMRRWGGPAPEFPGRQILFEVSPHALSQGSDPKRRRAQGCAP